MWRESIGLLVFLTSCSALAAELDISDHLTAPLKSLARPFELSDGELGLKKQHLPHPFTDLIDLHQSILSPADGPRSHFHPVSSTFARSCFKRFGARGVLLGFDRLMRENSEMWLYPLIEIDEGWIKCDLPPECGRFP